MFVEWYNTVSINAKRFDINKNRTSAYSLKGKRFFSLFKIFTESEILGKGQLRKIVFPLGYTQTFYLERFAFIETILSISVILLLAFSFLN